MKWSLACHTVEFWKKSHGKAGKTKNSIITLPTINCTVYCNLASVASLSCGYLLVVNEQ
jgi:hypothetical protein